MAYVHGIYRRLFAVLNYISLLITALFLAGCTLFYWFFLYLRGAIAGFGLQLLGYCYRINICPVLHDMYQSINRMK
jgi:hypothetical protein